MVQTLLIGAGRLGGALIEGWLEAGEPSAHDLIVRARTVTPAAKRAAKAGAALNPPDADLSRAQIVVLGVKPQVWREAAATYAPHLAQDAVIVSLMVGVPADEVARGFGRRRTVRAMPTTAVAIRRGVTTLYAADAQALAAAQPLFAAVGETVVIEDEALIFPATAVSGSGPGYLYAFVEALEAAGVEAGLTAEVSARLARATISGAAELMARSGADPADLRRQVASPGGTTQAALDVFSGQGGVGLDDLMRRAVAANIARAHELSR